MTRAQPDGATLNQSADGTHSPNTMRGMAMRPVNPLKATSMMGQRLDVIDGVLAIHITKDVGKTSDYQQRVHYRGS